MQKHELMQMWGLVEVKNFEPMCYRGIMLPDSSYSLFTHTVWRDARQAAQRSPLFQFAVSQNSRVLRGCIALNIRPLWTILK